MRSESLYIVVLFLILSSIQKSLAIWCYRCTSATPNCGENFHWRGVGFLGEKCPEDNDICVKVTERKHATTIITRDCLSALKPFRTDIPPDHYEGCYPSVPDPKLAHYVNNSIKQLDIKRDYYSDVEFCFCFLDHRCNGANTISMSLLTISLAIIVASRLV